MARAHSQRQRLLVIGCCALIALVCAVASVSNIGAKLSSRHLDVAAATTRVTIDVPRPLVTNALAQDGDFQALNKRAALVGNLMSSKPVLTRIAREARIDPSEVAAVTRITTGVQSAFTEPDSERRAAQIAAARKPYQLEVQPSQTLPLLSIYTQAPSVDEAVRLANAAVPATRRYLTKLARQDGLSPAKEVSLDQLGPAQGAIVNGGARVQIGGLTFLFVFAATLLLALGVARVRRGRRDVVAGYATPGADLARSVRQRRQAQASRTALQQAGDWPRTTRVLPWMVAVLIAVIFLIPFNDIQLNVSLPIDLKFDRLVLPFIIGTWALVLAAGGPNAPKLRLTWIHVALGAVVAVAFLSLVLDARGLNQTLEFDTSIKKLTLLASYVSLFVVVASVVRRTEVHAFMTLTLLLAIATALGMILEYRFEYNPFYSISDTVLPGIFQVGIIDPSGIDEIGRRAVQGPAQVPLEAVAMLAMALPIALVRLLQTGRTRDRILYALAAAMLLAAMVATFRKTAFLAPISVCLTLAYFRRRELLKLAPLGVVLVLVIQVLSPGALSAVASQLNSKRLGVTTVSDRTADYDAIRPDVWSHLAFGRGYGSYEHTSYRVLDMELLRQLIEVGVIGLLAYIMLVVAVVAVARGPIRARRSDDSPVALVVAAVAVCFLMVSTLFDVMSFPHVPYLFLLMAALLAVMTGPGSAEEQETTLSQPISARLPAGAGRDASTPKEPAWSS